MSDQKTIKLRFDENEKTVPMFSSYKECIEEFKKLFKISDEDAQRLSLFYYDSDGDQITFQADTDYDIFINDETQTEKIIEGELLEKDKEEIIIEEKPDPLKSGFVFSKKVEEQNVDLNLKNLDNSSILANSEYSIDSLANPNTAQKRNTKENEELIKGINQMNIMLNKTIEDKNKEDLIEKMKKEMDDMVKKHQEDLKKKEEENEKKYKDAYAE